MLKTRTQDKNDLDMRMKRGLAIIQNNGKSIVENEDGSFLSHPSRRMVKPMKSGYLGTNSFAPVLTLSIVKLTPVNIFTQSNYG